MLCIAAGTPLCSGSATRLVSKHPSSSTAGVPDPATNRAPCHATGCAPWSAAKPSPYLLLLPSQMCTPLSCSSRALVLPRMNHSSSSSTPAVHIVQQHSTPQTTRQTCRPCTTAELHSRPVSQASTHTTRASLISRPRRCQQCWHLQYTRCSRLFSSRATHPSKIRACW